MGVIGRVRHYTNLTSAVDVWIPAVGQVVFFTGMVIGNTISLLGIPLFLWLRLHHSAWAVFVGAIGLLSILNVVVLWPLMLPTQKNKLFVIPTPVVMIWPATGVAIYVLLLKHLLSLATKTFPSVLAQVAISGLMGSLVHFVAVVISLILAGSTAVVLNRRKRLLYPDAIIVENLLAILAMLENDKARWTDLQFKQELMVLLEDTASCTSCYLPRRLNSGDVATDKWVLETTEQMGAAIRSLKTGIAVPEADTLRQLIADVGTSFVHAAKGEWEKLGRKPAMKKTHRPRRGSKAWRVVHAFFTAAIPMLLFWLLQKTPLAIRGTPANLVSIGVYVWAALTLLVTFDPTCREKIEMIVFLVQRLASIGKGRSE